MTFSLGSRTILIPRPPRLLVVIVISLSIESLRVVSGWDLICDPLTATANETRGEENAEEMDARSTSVPGGWL